MVPAATAAAAASTGLDPWAQAGTDAEGSPAVTSGYVQDMMGQLEGSFQPREAAEVESMLRELYEVDGLLPQREVKVSNAVLTGSWHIKRSAQPVGFLKSGFSGWAASDPRQIVAAYAKHACVACAVSCCPHNA